METPNDVLISGERHLIILGQHGNLRAKINQLEHLLRAGEGEVFLPRLAEIDEELEYLVKYYPRKDGGLFPEGQKLLPPGAETNSPKINGHFSSMKIRDALKDMRLLMDCANTGYVSEGVIDCHLKAMLDEAWRRAADEVGIDDSSDIPF